MDLLTVGEAFEDVIFAGLPRLPQLGEELRVDSCSRHPGGGSVITAVAAARLGLRVATLTAVSRDIADALRAEGVRVINVQRAGERSACTVALSTPDDRAFVTFNGVNARLEPRLARALGRLPRAPRHVHFAFVPRRCGAWLPRLRRLRRHGITTSWDFGWQDKLLDDPTMPALLAALDFVFFNEREATLYARLPSLPQAMALWQSVLRALVIKRGAEGAVLVTPGAIEPVATRRVRALDTTGAGDGFNGGFLAAVLAGHSWRAAVRLGNLVGGLNVRRPGGIDGLPHHRDLPPWAQRLLVRR